MQTAFLSFIWILGSILTSFTGFLSPAINSPVNGSGVVHPFHVSVIEVNHNLAGATLEMQCKLYTDDFEATLSKLYKRKTDLTDKSMHAAMDTLVERYVLSHTGVKVNGKKLPASYLGFEQDKEAVYVYVELTQAPAVIRETEFTASLLYEQYEDQINIIHFSSGGKRKSVKLDNPQSQATLEF